MKILAIETSCDETSAAVVEDGVYPLSNIISSQVSFHAPFGGIVPEIASRKHLENILPVISEALTCAEISLDNLDAIAVTKGPGLVGALLVGIQTAKGIALTRNLPLIPVNHLDGHIHAIFLKEKQKTACAPDFPFISLLVSGGHTELYLVKGHGQYTHLGQTLDDAAGEAYDKVAKMMGLGYPGGPVIDKMAKEGNPKAISFPLAIMGKDNLNFSFSGLKTAVLYFLKKEGIDKETYHEEKSREGLVKDICASFQSSVVEVLVKKTLSASRKSGVKSVVLSGGVACNSYLRKRMEEELETAGGNLFYPSPILCTDNAGMIGSCAYFSFQAGNTAGEKLDARSRWPLSDVHYTFI